MSVTHDEPEPDGSSSDEDDDNEMDDAPPVQSLVEGRQKRATAGQRMSALINQEVDDDLELLFAEAEEEDTNFDALAAEDEEDADSSSSDESEHEGDELAGERQLDKEERAAKRAGKRKVNKAFSRPAVPRPKRVRIADDTTSTTPTTITPASAPGIGPPSQEPNAKRSKRTDKLSWIPNPADAPTRTSSRTLSVQSKEKTMANLKETEDRRIRQIAVMEAAQKRRGHEEKRRMTQVERLAEAVETERVNRKSLSRWEMLETERQNKEKAKQLALQNRTLAGPVITWYSGPAEWVDGKLTHVGKHKKIEEIVEQPKTSDVKVAKQANIPGEPDVLTEESQTGDVGVHTGSDAPTKPPSDPDVRRVQTQGSNDQQGSKLLPILLEENENQVNDVPVPEQSPPTPNDFLAEMRYYASLPETTNAESPQPSSHSNGPDQSLPQSAGPEMPMPLLLEEEVHSAMATVSPTVQPDPPTIPETLQVGASNPSNVIPTLNNTTTAEPPKTSESTAPTVTQNVPTAPAPPPEYSTRNLLILKNYDPTALKDKDIQRRIVFNTHGTKPAKPSPTLCAVTSAPARYRDPTTGLPYANLEAYRSIQKLVKGGCTWSSLLEAWVGVPDRVGLGAEVWRAREGGVEGGAGGVTGVKKEGGSSVAA